MKATGARIVAWTPTLAICFSTWVESEQDWRVRVVALTSSGKDLIPAAFRGHSGQMKKVFSELSPEELRTLEEALKKVGKRAASLMDKK